MQPPFFSIIIPVYKVRQDYLEACVQSICSQTFRDLEIILVEDGSPDGCGALCDAYAKQDVRIKVIHQTNQGVSAARNHGMEAAAGQWVLFVDADDWVADGAYEKLAAWLNERECDILMFGHIKQYAAKQVASAYRLRTETDYDTAHVSDKEELYRSAMKPNQSGVPGVYFCWDKAYRRSFLTQNGLRFPVGLPKSEDKVFVLYCFEKVQRFRFVNQPLYHYRINMESVCNRYSETADQDRIRLAQMLTPIAERMDAEMGRLKQQDDYTVLRDDCKRFLFGIISDALSLKFFHPDCPYGKRERRAMAKAFVASEPFRSCVKVMKYRRLSAPAKLKKALLSLGLVETYCTIYRLEKKLHQ